MVQKPSLIKTHVQAPTPHLQKPRQSLKMARLRLHLAVLKNKSSLEILPEMQSWPSPAPRCGLHLSKDCLCCPKTYLVLQRAPRQGSPGSVHERPKRPGFYALGWLRGRMCWGPTWGEADVKMFTAHTTAGQALPQQGSRQLSSQRGRGGSGAEALSRALPSQADKGVNIPFTTSCCVARAQ